MNEINLSLKERAQFTWMFSILKKLNPAEEKDYNWRIEVLTSGFKKEYREAISYEVMSDDEVSCEICEETRDILRMYIHLDSSYKKLDNKAGIDKERLTFKGFDNSEGPHLHYATFLLERMNRFQQLQNIHHDYDTHSAIIDKYRHMLKVYRKHTKGKDYNTLNKETIIDLLKLAP